MKKTESHEHKAETPKAPETTAASAGDAAGSLSTELTAVAELTSRQIDELKERAVKSDEYLDRLLRTAADFENFKKRAARERTETAHFATAGLIQKLLPALDHLEMAHAATQTADALQQSETKADGGKLASLQAGITMIQQQIKSVLAESGLEEIDATGKTFDPALHEAVSEQETSDAPEGRVMHQIRKGYKLRERLLRPAAVIVAKKPATNPG